MARVEIDRENLAKFCQANHIRKLALFGSVLRDDFGPTATWTCWWSLSRGTYLDYSVSHRWSLTCLRFLAGERWTCAPLET